MTGKANKGSSSSQKKEGYFYEGEEVEPVKCVGVNGGSFMAVAYKKSGNMVNDSRGAPLLWSKFRMMKM